MRLTDGHLARFPYGTVKSQRPSLPRTPVYYQIHIRITTLREPRLIDPFFVTRIEPIPLLQIELTSAIE